jgi:hypothetical protein
MTLLALLLAVAALAVFIVEVVRSRSLIAGGLALLTCAWIAAATIEGQAVRW